MLKRRLAPEPILASAVWSQRAGAFAAILAVMAVLLGRVGSVEPRAVVAVLGAALLCAIGGLALAVRAAVQVWRTGYRGSARALGGVAIALLVLGYPAYLAFRASGLPALNDVSTDPATAPNFSASPGARAARGVAAHPDPSPRDRELQRQFYPALAPAMLDLDAEQAYALALKLVTARRWKVIEAVPPKGRFGIGHIDAVAGSRVLGLPADVTIRLRPASGQTRVDVRSASRIEPHDVGSNAARIEAFTDDLENEE